MSFTNPHSAEEERIPHLSDVSRSLKSTWSAQQEPLVVRWQNKKDGAVVDDTVPSLRASGGTDIRKKPVIIGNIYPSGREAGAVHDPKGIFSTVKQGKRGGKAGIPPIAICDSGLHRQKQIRASTLPPLRANTGAGHDTILAIVADNTKGNIKDRVRPADKTAAWALGGATTHIGENMRIRRLTPVECERLQGFPDGWTAEGLTADGEVVEVSDTQRYRALGNAVTVNVIEFLGRLIMDGYGGQGD